MQKIYRCSYCGHTFPSQQGRRSHLSQAPKCRNKHQAAMETIWNSDNNEATEPRAHTPVAAHKDEDIPFRPWEDDFDGSNDCEPAAKKVRQDMTHGCPGDQQPRWIEVHPRKAGEQIRKGETIYEKLKLHQDKVGTSKWGPFCTETNWELAKWVLGSGAMHSSIDNLIKLKVVIKTS